MKANKLCATPQPEAVQEKKVKTAHQDLNKKNSQEDEATNLVGASSPTITKRHTKHKKNKSIEEDEATDLVGANSPPITKRHKKHKKNKSIEEIEATDLVAANSPPITKKHKKHKKNKSIEEDEEIDLVGANSPPITKKHKKHKNKSIEEDEEIDLVGANSPTITKKHEKHKKNKSIEEDEATDLVGASSPTITKKHKKHKKNKSIKEDEEIDLVGANSLTITKKHKKHKKNKVPMQSAYDPLGVAEARPSVASLLENETSEPQKHKTKRSKAEHLLEKKTSDPLEKKVKLCHDSGQKAVDKPVVTTTGHGIFQGQWQGQLFENNERQNKFLRLLGGMKGAGAGEEKKKGLFGSLGSSALTLEKAADLNSRLEDQYNKALHFKLTGKKGSGFGFTPDPAEGKKFHIDVNKTNSVQFDD